MGFFACLTFPFFLTVSFTFKFIILLSKFEFHVIWQVLKLFFFPVGVSLILTVLKLGILI